MNKNLKKAVIAIAMAFPMAAFAQNAAEVQNEIAALNDKLKRLQETVDRLNAAAGEGAGAQVQSERAAPEAKSPGEQFAASGLQGLKVFGYMDPTYIANKRQDTAGFVFMKNFADGNAHGGPGAAAPFAYDNGFFGSALIGFEKETESGVTWLLELMPKKSAGEGGGYDLNSVVNQAYVSIPLTAGTRLLAGQIGSWQGYECQRADMKKTITDNLLFDFTGPTFMTGIGLEQVIGDLKAKAIVGNMNSGRITEHRKPALHWRLDYAATDAVAFGMAGTHGRPYAGTRLNYLGLDASFTLGDLSLMAQVEAGRFKNGSITGMDTSWRGASVFGAYKLSSRLEAIVRADHVRNPKNGGGTPNLSFPECDLATGLAQEGSGMYCGDARNGFGPSLAALQAYGADPARGLVGANRTALTLGLNYEFNPSTLFKFEVRRDRATQDVFYDVKSAGYANNNTLVGFSTLVKF